MSILGVSCWVLCPDEKTIPTSTSVVEYSNSHSSSSSTGLDDLARGKEAALSGYVPGQSTGCLAVGSLTVRTISYCETHPTVKRWVATPMGALESGSVFVVGADAKRTEDKCLDPASAWLRSSRGSLELSVVPRSFGGGRRQNAHERGAQGSRTPVATSPCSTVDRPSSDDNSSEIPHENGMSLMRLSHTLFARWPSVHIWTLLLT